MNSDPGSYRDPSGHVHILGDRIFRTVAPCGQDAYRAVKKSGALDKFLARGVLAATREVAREELPDAGPDDLVLEHDRIPVISYPFEWPFEMLKDAALLHLDLQIEVLEDDVALSDASAFNVQFVGPKPVFIDYLSFRPYRDGEIWLAHRQFCEQFLNPLVLQARTGAPYHAWYRGQPEGIRAEELSPLLRLRQKMSPVILSHIALPARLQRRVAGLAVDKAQAAQRRGLSKRRFRALLLQLRRFIAGLSPAGTDRTVWSGYAESNTYESEETAAKTAFVARFAAESEPGLLVDLGCNTGAFSQAALVNGAHAAVGLDSDHGALHAAYARARRHHLNFLPLHQDLANPSSGLGWRMRERRSLFDRLSRADGVLALAVVHHLAIARNIPLDEAVGLIVDLAPNGVVEFVPKDDPTVRTMLALREDIFGDYDRDRFAAALSRKADIVCSEVISASGRELYRFRRR